MNWRIKSLNTYHERKCKLRGLCKQVELSAERFKLKKILFLYLLHKLTQEKQVQNHLQVYTNRSDGLPNARLLQKCLKQPHDFLAYRYNKWARALSQSVDNL